MFEIDYDEQFLFKVLRESLWVDGKICEQSLRIYSGKQAIVLADPSLRHQLQWLDQDDWIIG